MAGSDELRGSPGGPEEAGHGPPAAQEGDHGALEGKTVAYAVAAGGVLALGLGLVLRLRVLGALGLAGAVAGGGLFLRRKLAERSARIAETQSHIRSELDELDPVARAQVLAGLARSTL